jgi:ABC-type branched-subunit amino acid transport system ATPase component
MSDYLLEAEHLHHDFGGVTALTDVSVAVAGNEVLGVIGPNGSGKTTMLNVISRVLPLMRGEVRLGGESYGKVPAWRLTELGIARTFQNLRMFDDLTVLENVCLSLDNCGPRPRRLVRPRRGGRQVQVGALDLLRQAGLFAVANRLPRQLPYGVQRQVEVVRAIATQPRILLLDEPFAGMSSDEAAALTGLIKLARDRAEMGVIIVDHDMPSLTRISTRLMAMVLGRVLTVGSSREVLSHPEVIDAYVGTHE